MNQDDRRLYLIRYLLKERIHREKIMIPEDIQGQRDLLRSLMNVRIPYPISEEFLQVQDTYLQERNRERGIIDVNDLKPVESDSRLILYQGDITTLKCDGIVNACNAQMLGCFSPLHSCIDNCIHTYAGIQLRLEMNEIMKAQGYEEPTGRAKITSGYNLPASHILHTVGPTIHDSVTQEDEEFLASCYRSCLKLAEENNVETIAFCCISTGVFRFPNRKAAQIAVNTVRNCLENSITIRKVIFNVFKDEDLMIYNELLQQ